MLLTTTNQWYLCRSDSTDSCRADLGRSRSTGVAGSQLIIGTVQWDTLSSFSHSTSIYSVVIWRIRNEILVVTWSTLKHTFFPATDASSVSTSWSATSANAWYLERALFISLYRISFSSQVANYSDYLRNKQWNHYSSIHYTSCHYSSIHYTYQYTLYMYNRIHCNIDLPRWLHH